MKRIKAETWRVEQEITYCRSALAHTNTNDMTKASAPAVANCAKPSAKKKSKKASTNETTRLETLAKVAQENVEKFNKVANTDKNYGSGIRQVRKFLEGQIDDRRSRGIVICEQGIPTDEFEKALDNPPNQYSAVVLKMYITHKCFILKRKKGVAQTAHAAWCQYWDTM